MVYARNGVADDISILVRFFDEETQRMNQQLDSINKGWEKLNKANDKLNKSLDKFINDIGEDRRKENDYYNEKIRIKNEKIKIKKISEPYDRILCLIFSILGVFVATVVFCVVYPSLMGFTITAGAVGCAVLIGFLFKVIIDKE